MQRLAFGPNSPKYDITCLFQSFMNSVPKNLTFWKDIGGHDFRQKWILFLENTVLCISYLFLSNGCVAVGWLCRAKADSWMPKWKGRYKGHQGWAFLCMWVCNYGKTQCMCVSPLFKRFFSVLIFSKIAEICRISWFNRITFQVSSKLWNPGP